jgi:GTP pyrophosphokinase
MVRIKEKNISEIRKALLFMIDAHSGVYRKFSGKEYAYHPIEVAKIIRETKKSKHKEILIIAALLHDVVEDTDYTIEDIRRMFGDMVASIVLELTSDPVMIKKMGKAVYLLYKMLKMTSYALNIKLADRLHNCSDLAEGTDSFRIKYVKETRFILDGIKDRTLTKPHRILISRINEKLRPFE